MRSELEKYQQARIEALEKENQRLREMLRVKGLEV